VKYINSKSLLSFLPNGAPDKKTHLILPDLLNYYHLTGVAPADDTGACPVAPEDGTGVNDK
jgi:hypothetical protein